MRKNRPVLSKNRLFNPHRWRGSRRLRRCNRRACPVLLGFARLGDQKVVRGLTLVCEELAFRLSFVDEEPGKDDANLSARCVPGRAASSEGVGTPRKTRAMPSPGGFSLKKKFLRNVSRVCQTLLRHLTH